MTHGYWGKYLAAPTTQHEADLLAAKLFFLFLLILGGLIAAGLI
jgi:hypothetical protein